MCRAHSKFIKTRYLEILSKNESFIKGLRKVIYKVDKK